ncbi:MAG TPA: 16S rRNA (guanine(966)-N(2))-methyltransferase RsmD [Xanthomonadales bacterium]|nr:16S rRNA (guanine(966)-N(2))-methyltransferase RsmD [Xanthomonadales bacterium]
MANKTKRKKSGDNRKPGSVRIIGGEWRGRRLPVADLPGLRPSGDRARETLFNWLQPFIRGARCVDLFAGTGVLGLEAYSRGAAEVTLVENMPLAVQTLRAALVQLGVPGAKAGVHLVESDALRWLQACEPGTLDIVFLDPPFGSRLETRSINLIVDRELVCVGGLVYVETSRNTPPIHPGLGWEILKDQVQGEVRMLLLRRSPPPVESR